jgi:hypothetical protein
MCRALRKILVANQYKFVDVTDDFHYFVQSIVITSLMKISVIRYCGTKGGV